MENYCCLSKTDVSVFELLSDLLLVKPRSVFAYRKTRLFLKYRGENHNAANITNETVIISLR